MQKKLLLYVVVGARPNFVKAAPILSSMKDVDGLQCKLIHSGQHYDYAMSKSFFDLFKIPEPDYNLGIGSASHGAQTGRMLIEFEKLFKNPLPDLVVVLGDVNSTIAAALAAVKLNITVAHVEAGLRSFDRRMPEEINRILTDHISHIHFGTEKSAVKNLATEGIAGANVHLVGNVMIDALLSISSKIENSTIIRNLSVEKKKYSVVTLHRPSNVDSKEGLLDCIEILKLASNSGEVVFPMHPRTAKSIDQCNVRHLFNEISNLKIINPLCYDDFMSLVNSAAFIMTDSGGIQSEASFLKVPCITLRDSTEHIITIEKGTNTLTGMDFSIVEESIRRAREFNREQYKVPELLDGRAASRITEIVKEKFNL